MPVRMRTSLCPPNSPLLLLLLFTVASLAAAWVTPVDSSLLVLPHFGIRSLRQGERGVVVADTLTRHRPATQMNLPAKAAAAAGTSNSSRGTVLAPAVVGRLGSIIQKFTLLPSKLRPTWQALANAFDLSDVALLGVIAWLPQPLAKRYLLQRLKDKENDEDYQKTLLFRGATTISQLAKVAGIIYAFDMVSLALTTLGFATHPDHPGMFAKSAHTAWVAWRIRNFKQFMLRKRKLDEKTEILSRVLDGLIAVCTFLFFEDICQWGLGKGVTSVLAAGGIAGLVFSLASKDLASAIVNAFALRISGKFKEGDLIRLGDGTTGSVQLIGSLETHIKGTDGIVIRIPNTQLNAQRSQNLARTDNCQVKQVLGFHYDDLDKIPDLVESIKEEIRISCPKLITDGRRPFRVHMNDFKEDRVEVLVNVNFDLKPYGDEYMDNRNAVLMAIARAVEKNAVEFSVPNYISKNVDFTQERTKQKGAR